MTESEKSMNNVIMTNEMTKEYHDLISKVDRTKEENRRLNVLCKLSHSNGLNNTVLSLNNLDGVNILTYDRAIGLYRVQTTIKGKLKTIARVKVAKNDAYILVRESTAVAIGIKDYEIINYNLPAGYHISNTTALHKNLLDVIEYHNKIQTA